MARAERNVKADDIEHGDDYTPPFPPSMVIFTDDLELLDDLTEDQTGKVIIAVIKTFLTGESQRETIDDPEVRAAYRVISKGVERNKDSYFKKCIKNRENRRKKPKESEESEENPFRK